MSVNPTKKNNLLKTKKQKVEIDKFYHILHNTKYGKTSSFKIHKSVPYIFSFLLLSSIIAIILISNYCINLQNNIAKLESINYSNRNLKGEVEALTLKIKNIQNTMNQMENLSSKIQKASARDDDRFQSKNNPTPSKKDELNQEKISQNSNNSITDNSLGIGPLTKEEYELSKHLTGIKQNNLQLRYLFDEVDSSQEESSRKLIDFKKLMAELRKYNIKLHSIPDIAPTIGRLSSTYGWRISPFSKKERMHLGLDIAATMGTPIYATADGTVVRTAITEDYGRMLEIQHTSKLLTRYGHTSRIYVKEGQKVKKGEIIAAVGSTGYSTGPHVHYEIEVEGKRVDPETYIVLW